MLKGNTFAHYKIFELEQRHSDVYKNAFEVLFCYVSLSLVFTLGQDLVLPTSSPFPSLPLRGLLLRGIRAAVAL